MQELGRQIGAGAYGSVFSVPRGFGSHQAAKVFTRLSVVEITILMKLSHQNLCTGISIAPVDVTDDFLKFAVVMPRFSADIETSRPKIEEAMIYLEQMMSAIEFLHMHNILHLDIKLSNYLCK